MQRRDTLWLQEGARKHGWSFKVWALCYVTSFTEVRWPRDCLGGNTRMQ
jgi:hypothetical protein